jgi:indole-3-glycerol phosphate synthase
MLEKFRQAKEKEIAALLEKSNFKAMPSPLTEPRPGFTASLRQASGPAVIAEYKRASPSRGVINMNISPAGAAMAYAAAGARALSVLTEETYFKGNIAFLEAMFPAGLPLLRKDFIFHPLQVDATAATRASAVLVIVRMLDDHVLHALLERARFHGLEAVVEVFDRPDLLRAREAGATVIQVNNRDLDTLRVDFTTSRELVRDKRDGEFWITASGIQSKIDLAELLALGFDAALVGTSLMAEDDPGTGLAALLGKTNHD